MSLNYSHTLIAKPPDFVPSAMQVQEFFVKLVAVGVIPGKPEITLLHPSGKFRRIRNPFTGEIQAFEMSKRKQLKTMDAVAKAGGKLLDYEVMVEGVGRPKLPPLPIEFKEQYAVTANCRISPKLLSTSDLHEESGFGKDVASFGQPAGSRSSTGYFSNPHDMSVIKVPSAGAARFWIQFQLGKFLFPAIENANLQLLHPDIVALARRVFGIVFVQGCHWG